MTDQLQLKSVQIKNFRSIEDSTEFSVDHQTCLVGKNESGKTAILQALAGVNPHPATPFSYEVERDYPKRYLARYKERHQDEEAVVAITEWQIPDVALRQIKEEFGEGSITSDRVTITRAYNSERQWTVPISCEKAISHLISKANFSGPEKSQVGHPTTTQELIEKLRDLSSNPKHKALLDKVSAFPNVSISNRVQQVCEPYLPQFMYFSNYDRMSPQVHLPSLKKAAEDGSLFEEHNLRNDRLFWEFLEFSGVSLDEIISSDTFESFNSKLRAASNHITEQILEYWTQNQDIEVQVNVSEGRSGDPAPFHSGAVGRARIYNTLHKADTSFSERSAGFTWFFFVSHKVRSGAQGSSQPCILTP